MSAPENARQPWYEALRMCSAGSGNDRALAQMIASHCCGKPSMPPWFGLEKHDFALWYQGHFPGMVIPAEMGAGCAMDSERMDERADLLRLMSNYGEGCAREEYLRIAAVIINGCMGNDHLWRNLGLWDRVELSKLIQRNFTVLFDRNEHDMKWKKFLYKQLCDEQGIYTCRAPSCEYCVSYMDCYSQEDK